jgi:hypothetical protein
VPEITEQYSIRRSFFTILDNFMYDRFIYFVNKYNILSEAQNGYKNMK